MLQSAGSGGVLFVHQRALKEVILKWTWPEHSGQSRLPLAYINSMTWHLPMKCAPVVFTSLPALFSEFVNPQLPKTAHFPVFPQSTRQNICKVLFQTRIFQKFLICKKWNNPILHASKHHSLGISIFIWNKKYFEYVSIPAWLLPTGRQIGIFQKSLFLISLPCMCPSKEEWPWGGVSHHTDPGVHWRAENAVERRQQQDYTNTDY